MRLPTRFFLLAAALAVLSTLALDLAAGRLLARQLEESFADRLARETSLLAADLPMDPPPDARELATRIEEIGRQLALRVTIVAPDGRVLADNERSPEEVARLENHLHRPEIEQAMATGLGRAIRHSSTVEADLLYLARRIESRGRTIGFVRLAVPLESIAAVDRASLRLLWGWGALALGLALLAAAWGARALARPVGRVRDSALAIAGGAFDEPIDEGRDDEIGDLARAVARMRFRLLEALERSTRERGRLESILAAMEEGVLLVDRELVVTFANERMRSILGASSNPAGAPLVDLLRIPEAVEAFRTALSESRGSGATLRFGGSRPLVLELRVVPAENPDRPGERSAVGLFLDMTRVDSLERVRRQFVADVSHELRTPITSARAAAETLLSSGGAIPAELARFPEILSRQIRKMEELVDDLTDLSLIETGAITLSPETFALAPLVREVVDEVAGKWPGIGERTRIDLPTDLEVVADRRRLGQVLTNLIDNAAKFAETGEIAVRGSRCDGSVTIEVEDRGIGIPDHEQERVFERFYQVDRSRSKSKPGTGLGLAIVRHLVLLQGGRIFLTSTPGKGSCFRLELPAATG
jgi:two-component system phosphate regulon sensor histidine kinase PhoR